MVTTVVQGTFFIVTICTKHSGHVVECLSSVWEVLGSLPDWVIPKTFISGTRYFLDQHLPFLIQRNMASLLEVSCSPSLPEVKLERPISLWL